jgi:putative ABC transport system substrate-binding protein
LPSPLAASRRARAQPAAKVPRVGVLAWFSADAAVRFVEPLRQSLRELNHIDGSTIQLEFHWADHSPERAAAIARDLVDRQVDVIVAWATPAAHAAKHATQSVPVVMMVADPLATGLVSNLKRPGGNLTGFGSLSTELSGKRLELLSELLPGLRNVAFLGSSRDPQAGIFVRETEAAAASLSVAVRTLMADTADFESAFASMQAEGVAAVIVQPIFLGERARIAALALKYRLPAISDFREFAAAGLLIAYGSNPREQIRRVASYVDRILKGAKPGDLPIEQPTRFEMVINLRTAKALGLAIPPAVLARADEVID